MYAISISENIAKLRRERKITQEQLAEFLGVTKASVSKWETGQSIPDVLMLPQLANYFDVTIDKLMGYEPQLSEEQILKTYRDLCVAFVQEPFEEVMEKSKKLLHQYYSCYPFVYRICLLWMNHYMLANEENRKLEILAEASELCNHIMNNSKNIVLCNDVVNLHATINLLQGDTKTVIETLVELQNPSRISNQGIGVLIKAYVMANEMENAERYAQVGMYSQVITLIGCATEYLSIHSDNLEICQETIKRISVVAEVYKVEQLNFNAMAVFYYQAVIVFCLHGQKEQALEFLEKFVNCIEIGFSCDEVFLHGDTYFSKMDSWFEQLEYGGGAPRERKIVLNSAIEGLQHPAFACLWEDKKFKRMNEKWQNIEIKE